MSLRDLFSLTQEIVSGPAPVLARTRVNGVIVSTVDTNDCGPETAVICSDGTHPVERYSNREDALAGHERWCETMKTATKIHKLGYGESVDPTDVDVVRDDNLIDGHGMV